MSNGSVYDFLFEGRPPQSVTTYGQTVENIPKWMSDYTQGLIARANAAAAEPYIPYGGPRIAGFTPEQQAAWGLTEANIGAYQPYLEAGAAGYGGGLSRAANIGRAAAPFVASGAQDFRDPGMVESYMSPYIGNVLDRQEALATRTLEEEFLPRLQRTFGGAGQYGSRGGFGSMEDIGVRGVRDIQEGLEAQRLEALHGAYGQAADIFGQQRQREAELARIVGALEEAGAQQMFAGAEGLGRMGEAAQRMGLTDAASLEAIGAQQQGLSQRALDLAYQDFLEQRQLPFDRLAFMSNLIRGLPMDRMTTRTDVGPADIYQPSPLSQIIGAYGVYRGLQNPQGGQAEGGYIDGKGFQRGGLARVVIDLDSPDYSVEIEPSEEEGDEMEYAEGGYAYPKAYAEGGLAQYANGGFFQTYFPTFSRWGQGVSQWARALRPKIGQALGIQSMMEDAPGGKFLKLDEKQD